MNDDHKNLKKIVGGRAYNALLKGRPLQIWRMSSPHNWFIETADGINFLWHSAPKYPYPSLSLFYVVSNSEETVPQYWGADSCIPRLTKYRLRKST